MKVLTIGQLPKEVGGSYTTGVARVIYELCQRPVEGVDQYVYATNVTSAAAKKIPSNGVVYFGYRMLFGRAIANILLHPIKTIQEWQHYIKVCHVNPLRFEIYKANFQKVLKVVEPDLIHFHGDGIAPLHFALAKKRIPVVRTYHGLIFKGDAETTQYKIVRDDALGNKDFADFNTALTEENKKEVARLGIDENKIAIVPNGNDSSAYYYSKEERERLRREMGVGENTTVFVTVGVVIERKGQLAFIKAIADMPYDYQYWIIGRGIDEEPIRSYVKEHKLEEKVKLIGYVDMHNMYQYLSAADVFAHVSFTEGQSLAEIEAYATGLRIIVNKDIAGTVIGDAYHDKTTYYIIDLNHEDNNKLMDWLRQKQEPRKSRGNFDWKVIAERYVSVYRKVLESF